MSLATASLGEIAEVAAGGGAPQNADAFTAEGTPFIRAGSLNPLVNGASESTLEHLTDEVAKEHGLRKFPRDTVVFAKSGMSATKGHVYRLRNEAYVVNHLAAIVPTQRVVPEFLEHSLRVFSPVRLIQDAAYPSVRLSDVATMKIPLPPLAEQRRIAEVLDRAEALRAKRRAALAQLDSLTQSLFLDLFGDPTPQIQRFPIQPLETILQQPLQNGAYYPKESYTEVGGVEMVHMSDAFYDVVPRGKLKRVICSKPDLEKYALSEFDILIARRSLTIEGAAKPCLIPKSSEPLIFESSFIRVTPHPDKITALYLFHYLGNERVKQKCVQPYITQSTISGINQSNLERVPVIVPPLPLQREFARRVTAVEALKTAQRASLAELDALFATLQHRAFRGEL